MATGIATFAPSMYRNATSFAPYRIVVNVSGLQKTDKHLETRFRHGVTHIWPRETVYECSIERVYGPAFTHGTSE